MDRRELLQSLGAASVAATTGLAGCSSITGGGGVPDGDRAGFDSWTAASMITDSSVGGLTVDLEMFHSLEDEGTETATTTEAATTTGITESDPLAGIAASYVVAAAFGVGLGFFRTGLQSFVEEDGGGEFVHYPPVGAVVEGSFETDDVASEVEGADGTELESYEGYTIYEQGSSSSSTAIAVGDGVAVKADEGEDVTDPVQSVKDLIDANAGDSESYSSTSEDYEALVTALPNEGVTGVQYDSEGGLFESDEENESESGMEAGLSGFSDVDLEGDAVGAAVTTTFTETELEVMLAIQYASEGEVDDTSAVEDALGTEADSRSIDVDGKTLYVSGTYTEEDPLEE
jgi:hypothetical protein